MKKTIMKFSTSLIIAFSFLLINTSCEGEDGAIGPQGEQGAQGEQGTQGNPGTANVIYSDWIASGLEQNVSDGFDAFDINASEITQEVMDTGVILVYAKQGIAVYQIPLTLNGNINESYYYRVFNIGELNIAVEGANGVTNIGAPFLQLFRYVIIPGGQSSRSALDYQSMSYNELCTLFNIPK